MIAVLLERAGLDPSYLIGGDLNESGSGARSGARRPLRLRGRRERRLLPPDAAAHRGRDERRCRPRRLLSGRSRGDRGRVRRLRSRMRHGRGMRRRCRGAVGARRRGHADRALWPRAGQRPRRLRRGARARRARRGTIRDASGAEAAVRLQVDGPHNLLNAAAAIGVAGLVGVPLTDAAAALRDVRGGAPAVRASRAGTRRRLLRRLRAHADRDGGHDRHGSTPRPGPARRARAAASVLTGAGALAGARRERRRRRPRARHRRVRGGPGADPRGDGPARRRRRRSSPRRRRPSSTSRTARRSSTISSARSGRAT